MTFAQELINAEKFNIKNLLISSQVWRQKKADVIVKIRKRMALNNTLGDEINDALARLFGRAT